MQVFFQLFYKIYIFHSRLHGVCNENPLSPVIRRLGLTMYRTSGDDSILYDHDLERYGTILPILP